jgi:hypothetical protein
MAFDDTGYRQKPLILCNSFSKSVAYITDFKLSPIVLVSTERYNANIRDK